MAQKTIFNALSYFKMLGETNILAKENEFATLFCSGAEGIEEAIAEFKKAKNYILIDDTTSKNTFSRGVTYFDKNVYTVFILAQFTWDDMQDREEKLNLCRQLFRQFHSRLLYDKHNYKYYDALEYLDTDSILSKEFDGYMINGVTGLYFMVENTEPVDLRYNKNEWEEE